jgi:xanthine dehydrogenase/oxidase
VLRQVSLSELEAVCKEEAASRPAHEAHGFTAVARQLRWFAGRQVRNVSSIGGNVATASPISDLNPLWMACDATFALASAARGERLVQVRKALS